MNTKTKYVKSVTDFIQEINAQDNSIFRGQTNSNWDLIPSIVRFTDSIEKIMGISHNNPLYELVLDGLMVRFREQYNIFSDEKIENGIHAMTVAQHWGMPTQLLDWTTNPLIALFFACENKYTAFNDENGNDGAVWQLMYTNKHINKDYTIKKIYDGEIIFSKKNSKRMQNQSGLFTFHALPIEYEDGEFIPLNHKNPLPSNIIEIKKIIIHKLFKNKIIGELNNLFSINHSFIYPDLGGLCLAIKNDVIYNRLGFKFLYHKFPEDS